MRGVRGHQRKQRHLRQVRGVPSRRRDSARLGFCLYPIFTSAGSFVGRASQRSAHEQLYPASRRVQRVSGPRSYSRSLVLWFCFLESSSSVLTCLRRRLRGREHWHWLGDWNPRAFGPSRLRHPPAVRPAPPLPTSLASYFDTRSPVPASRLSPSYLPH